MFSCTKGCMCLLSTTNLNYAAYRKPHNQFYLWMSIPSLCVIFPRLLSHSHSTAVHTRHAWIPVSEQNLVTIGPLESTLFFYIWKANPEIFCGSMPNMGSQKRLFVSVRRTIMNSRSSQNSSTVLFCIKSFIKQSYFIKKVSNIIIVY